MIDNEKKESTIDLEYWMTNLPIEIRSIPLINTAIPGTHDSITYAINRKSGLSPDAERILKALNHIGGPIVRCIMSRWTKCQKYDVTMQLRNGIRYFDLRFATKKGSDQLYIVHGLYSCEINDVFSDIDEFLNMHPHEVIILDCQHFYAMGPADHEKLMFLISKMFGSKLIPYTNCLSQITLEKLGEKEQQVLVIYRSDAALYGQPLWWPSKSFPSPWPDTVSKTALFEKLNRYLKMRQASCGFISQCVLTPTPGFIIRHVFSSLDKRCVAPMQKKLYQWVRNQRIGNFGVNIIIADYTNSNDNQFCVEVINLNYTTVLKEGDHSSTHIQKCTSRTTKRTSEV